MINEIYLLLTRTSKIDMTLRREFSEIEAMCDLMDLTKEILIQRNNCNKRAHEEKLLRGKNKSAIYLRCV